MTKYYIESLGCAKNLVDSEVFAAIFERAGLECAPLPEEADLILVNTCSFLEAALLELDLVLSDLAALKNQGEFDKLIVSGCVMQRGRDDFEKHFPEVDAWIGLKDFAALERWLGLEISSQTSRLPIYHGCHRYLRVSDGCSNHCSFCAIPSIRGEVRSQSIDELVQEAQAIATDGDTKYRELIVIAQDTANYGIDLYGRKALPELLERLVELPQYSWIRVMYLHPDHFDLDWLYLWKKHPKLLPYFELPIQHSEDRILRAMNRKKGRLQLEELFQTIKREIPHAALRTTLMSGFPGETRAEAIAMKRFIHNIPFDHLGVFAYSRETGTPAFHLEGQVSARTVQRRQDTLLMDYFSIREKLLENLVGKNVEVIVETHGDDEDTWMGRAWFQAPDVDGITHIEGKNLQPGRIYRADITDAIGPDLFATVNNQEDES